MSEPLRRALAAGLTAALAAIVIWGVVVGEPVEPDRVEALGARIKCPVCQGESIVDSPAGFARDMLGFVREKVDEGWTDEEILTYLEDRFPGTRLDPGFSGIGLILWVLPVAGAAAGIAFALGRLRRPGTKADDEGAALSESAVGDRT